LGETSHTLLIYWVANVPLKEMIFNTAFSQRWLLKLSTTSKKKINKEYHGFSLAPFQVLRPQTFSLVGKFVIFDHLSTSSVFLFFIFPPLYVTLIRANHLQLHYHRPKYVFINHFWSLRLQILFLFFLNRVSIFSHVDVIHMVCFINCLWKCISKTYEKYLLLTHLRKHWNPIGF
jgi:hypothetical protein